MARANLLIFSISSKLTSAIFQNELFFFWKFFDSLLLKYSQKNKLEKCKALKNQETIEELDENDKQ